MDEAKADRGRRTPSLTAALRLARAESAERSQVVYDLNRAEMARLEFLREALAPVLAEVPENVTLFDVGLAPGDTPRLFIDMIAYVEMARDRRLYRFVQDTRHGPVTLAEDDNVTVIVDAVTHYMARRLIERERALAGLAFDPSPPPVPAPAATPPATPAPADPGRTAPRNPVLSGLGYLLRAVIDLFGVVTLAILLWMALQVLRSRFGL